MQEPNKIRVLSQDTVDKIAAGEVIERPASIVKELLENAMDAGAKAVSVELAGGGMEMIRVSDDGCGMSETDARLSVLPHATSKIASSEDLQKIRTLGFRGEALASMAAVSLLQIETGQDQDAAFRLIMEGGVLREATPCVRRRGTTVTVRELFFNTPARKKFLRSERSELGRCLEMAEELSMVFPAVSFRVLHNDRTLLDLPVAGEKDRLSAVFGNETVTQSSWVEHSENGIRLRGLAGHPQIARRDTRSQYAFVNGRPFTDRRIFQAVRRAYGTLLPHGHFPLFVLFLDVDPETVDVNVHPAKREVRFSNEEALRRMLDVQVSHALRASGFALAQFSIRPDPEPLFSAVAKNPYPEPFAPAALQRSTAADWAEEDAPLSLFAQSPSAAVYAEAEPGKEKIPSGAAHFFQLHNLYILTPIKNGLLLIDQHAAHERILYEKALEDLSRNGGVSQQLIFPVVAEFTPAQFGVVESNLALFEKLGFHCKSFGGNSIVIEGVPPAVPVNEVERALRDMVGYLLDTRETDAPLHDRFAKSFACGAAMKAGHEMSGEEMAALVDMLFSTRTPYTCPHGRPTVVRMSLDDIARRFMR